MHQWEKLGGDFKNLAGNMMTGAGIQFVAESFWTNITRNGKFGMGT